jgi:hypothetical protein
VAPFAVKRITALPPILDAVKIVQFEHCQYAIRTPKFSKSIDKYDTQRTTQFTPANQSMNTIPIDSIYSSEDSVWLDIRQLLQLQDMCKAISDHDWRGASNLKYGWWLTSINLLISHCG